MSVVRSPEIEVIHRAGDIQIGVGVEALDELQALVAQVAFDLEIGVERKGGRAAILVVAAELPVQGEFGQIGDVGAHAGHAEPFVGPRSLVEIIAAAPVRIRHDGLPPDFVKRDILGRMSRRRGDRQCGENPVRVARGPLQHLHAAHGTAEYAEQARDPEPIDEGACARTMSPMVRTGKSRL